MTEITNLQRAVWAECAVNAFRQQTGCDEEDSLGDLLCDLTHWARATNFDFDLALDRARMHFDAERNAQWTAPTNARLNAMKSSGAASPSSWNSSGTPLVNVVASIM